MQCQAQGLSEPPTVEVEILSAGRLTLRQLFLLPLSPRGCACWAGLLLFLSQEPHLVYRTLVFIQYGSSCLFITEGYCTEEKSGEITLS